MFHPTQDNIVLNELHFILPSHYYAKKEIKKALEKFGFTSAILSRIFMTKEKCITREKYGEMYQTDEESDTRMDLSVGEDLETFIEKIKNGKMNKDTIPKHYLGDYRKTFLLCLLDEEESKKLEQKDETFMKIFSEHNFGREADVPETEWKASDSNMKFAKSSCSRKTYFIDASIKSSDSSSDLS